MQVLSSVEREADVRKTAITLIGVPSPVRYTRRRWLVIRGGARCNWSSSDGFLIFTSAFTSASRACRAPVTTFSLSKLCERGLSSPRGGAFLAWRYTIEARRVRDGRLVNIGDEARSAPA
jgi:hypothetical protein